MPDMKLLKEPGYIYDLFFIFFWKCNKDRFGELFDLDQEEVASFESVLQEFEPISDDLFVFFHALKNGRCFIPYHYFSPYREFFCSEYNLAFLQEKLSDHSGLCKKMIGYYFYDLTQEQIDSCAASLTQLFDVIKTSSYSDFEKIRLYEFFVNPSSYIRKLCCELVNVEERLAKYYEKNYTKILDAYNSITLDNLQQQIHSYGQTGFRADCFDTLYLSFCLLNKNCVSYYLFLESAVMLWGYDYASSLERLQKKKVNVKLNELGMALCEENRIKILEYILEKGAATCKEMERQFSFSGSTAYHHLTTMTKYGVLKTYSEGKTVYYSINQKYFKKAIEVLQRFMPDELLHDSES